jgi:predicted nuclease with TOPRIM domain|tara:strand:- start:420 stop:869 length:450 start_codon:yes stop_codon:yes gene_type:complete
MKENKIVRYDRTNNKCSKPFKKRFKTCKRIMVNVAQEGMINDGTNDIGYGVTHHVQEYDVNAMKKIYSGITAQVVQCEKQLKEIKLRQTTTTLNYPVDELKELKAKIAELKTLDQMEQDEQGKNNVETSLKRLRKEASQLKPILEKLRK